MKESAFITGASRGIGEACALQLLKEGYEVYGIGRDFSACQIQDPSFHPIVLDLLETEKLLQVLEEMKKKNVRVVINNAGAAWYGLHETLTPEEIAIMLRTDLEVPEIIAGRLIPTLRSNQGWLINIASVTALSSSTHAAAYGSAKAGLLHFSRTLFDENRKYGMKVTCILPDLTESGLYRNADFMPSDQEGEHLEPKDTADLIHVLLHLPNGVAIPEIVLRPQKNRIQKKIRQ